MGYHLNKMAKTSPVKASLEATEFSLLWNFSKEINKSLNLNKVLQCLAEKASQLLKADACLIHLLDDKEMSFTVRKRYNLGPEFSKPLDLQEGVARFSPRHKKAVILPGIHKNPNFLLQQEAQKEGFVNAVCMPLQGNRKTIGILIVFNRKARRYSGKDIYLLDSFASQASGAIEKATAYEKIKNRLNEFTQVKEEKKKRDLTNQITQTEKSYQKLFDAVNDAIFSLNQDGYFATFNRMFLKMTGYTENEIKSFHFSKILHPEDRPLMMNDHQKVMRGEYAPERYTFRLINKEGKVIYVEGNFRRLKEGNEVVGILGVLRDVSEKIKLERELLELSITDGLTGLHNQRHFYKELDKEMERSKRQKTPLCLLLFDLDGFKEYNDLKGHLEGDKVLKGVAEAVLKSIRKMDSAFRYGGDEFTIILPAAGKKAGVLVAERIKKSFEKIPSLKQMSLSIGLVEFDPQYDLTTFVNHADAAMYAAKKKGGNQISVFPPEMA
jgi:diguanylate cyclase (GGDEF)-like protein/PAS domain S-box-containing protein